MRWRICCRMRFMFCMGRGTISRALPALLFLLFRFCLIMILWLTQALFASTMFGL